MFEKLAKDPKLIKPARIAATIPIDHIDTRGMFLEFVLANLEGSKPSLPTDSKTRYEP